MAATFGTSVHVQIVGRCRTGDNKGKEDTNLTQRRRGTKGSWPGAAGFWLTSEFSKSEWADGAANALNPGSGQTFRCLWDLFRVLREIEAHPLASTGGRLPAEEALYPPPNLLQCRSKGRVSS